MLIITGLGFPIFSANIWSLQYLVSALGTPPFSYNLPVAPSSHRRSSVWLSRRAFVEKQYDSVIATTTYGMAFQEDPLAAQLAGQAYLAQGRDTDAISIWREVGYIDALLNAAKQKETENHPDMALAYLRGAYEVNEEEVALILANSLHHQGFSVEALGVLGAALSDFPDSQYRANWMALSVTLLRIQEAWSSALSMIDRWQMEFPANSEPIVQRALTIYESSGDLTAAIHQLEQAIALDPGYIMGYLQLGRLLNRARRYADAEVYYEQAAALSLDGGGPGWRLEHANNLREGEELDRALVLYEDILRNYPDYANAYYQQAWAFHLAGRHEDALSAMRNAMRTLSDLNQYHYARAGFLAEQASEIDLAIEYYERAKRIDPTYQVALDGLSRLSSR
jgi:tetratricopeptide (TPR) repeat protein